MKKSMFAVAMVVVFIIAMAGTAYATWANSGYTNWSTEASPAASGNPTGTAHAGYISSSKNCAVCHAVHRANASGQILLASSLANACSYCHVVTTPNGITQVYSSQEQSYTTDTALNHASKNYDGSASIATCNNCHSVHSYSTVANGRNILKVDPARFVPVNPYQSMPTTAGAAEPSDAQITQYCSACHPYYNTNYNGTSHVMKAAGSYAGSGTVVGQTVATLASSYCISCHDQTVGFPHNSTSPRFIKAGILSGTGNAGKVNNDGVCLTCHGGATVGVGTNF